MKKIIKLIPLLLSLSFCLVSTSCGNLAGGNGVAANTTIVFQGSFSVDKTFINPDTDIEKASRSAQPTLPAIPANKYYAKATNGSETITSTDIDGDNGTFSIPLKTGSTWTIEVGATGTSAVDPSITNAVLIKDSTTFNPDTAPEPKIEHKFNLVPQITDSGTGKLNLRVKIENPTGNKITKVEIVPKKCLNKPGDTAAITAGWSTITNWNSGALIYSSSLSDFYIQKPAFKSGIWQVAVNFRDNQEQLLYSSIQTICVYDYLETKTWESSKTVSASNELIPSEGTNEGILYLTTLLVDSYGLTDFYVNHTSGNDDTGNGSPMKPFATITKAISVVNGLGRLDKTYTIHVIDGFSQTIADSSDPANTSTIVITANLSIECYKVHPGDRNGTATITSQYKGGPIIQIGEGTTTASLTIDGIRNNDNTPNDISDDTWTGLQLVASRSNIGTMPTTTRGVVINANSSLFMNGGSITGNQCNNLGAGVYISTNAYFVFTGGRITGNNSNSNVGGGVYIAPQGDLLIKGGIITNNATSSSVAGAGIYVAENSGQYGNITINGACYISGNLAGSSANNIYLPNTKLIKVSGKIDGSTIGITTQTVPTIGNNILFTNGYAYGKDWSQNTYVNNGVTTHMHPSKYFHSDKDGFSVLTDPIVGDTEGEACLGISGGTITPYTTPTINVNFFAPQATTPLVYPITITCSETAPDWTGSDSTNTSVTLKCNGVNVPASFWTYSYDNNTLTLQSTLPAGTYVIHVDVQYKGYKYSATQRITKS